MYSDVFDVSPKKPVCFASFRQHLRCGLFLTFQTHAVGFDCPNVGRATLLSMSNKEHTIRPRRAININYDVWVWSTISVLSHGVGLGYSTTTVQSQ